MESEKSENFQLGGLNFPKCCHVAITTTNGSTFTGILHSVDRTSGKIIVNKVTSGGIKLFGPQNFYASDIDDLKILSDLEDAPLPKLSTQGRQTKISGGLEYKKTQPPHLSKILNLDTDDMLMSNIFRDDLADLGSNCGKEECEDFYEMESYTLICRVCEKFYEAIEYIKEQEAVGVTFDGQKLGRDGTLSLIQVATDSELIIFDMIELGSAGFNGGLTAILESEDILKVIHDCRWISDLLKCQYGLSLANIFDTQVANAFVYRSLNRGDWPRYVESLPGCIINYLNVSDVFCPKVRERCRDEDEAVWLQRPLSGKLLAAATKNTIHLLPLYRVLLSEMLIEFKAGVGIYLDHVSGSVGDVERCRINCHLLPHAFTSIYNYVRPRSCGKGSREEFSIYDKYGFKENLISTSDKAVVFSRDSAWHKSRTLKTNGYGRGTLPSNLKNSPAMGAAPAEERCRPKFQKPMECQGLGQETKPTTDEGNSNRKEDKSETVGLSPPSHSTTLCKQECEVKTRTSDCQPRAHDVSCLPAETSCQGTYTQEEPINTRTGSPAHTAASALSSSLWDTSATGGGQQAVSLIHKSKLWKLTQSGGNGLPQASPPHGDHPKKSPSVGSNIQTAHSQHSPSTGSNIHIGHAQHSAVSKTQTTSTQSIARSNIQTAPTQHSANRNIQRQEKDIDLSQFSGSVLCEQELHQAKELSRKIAVFDQPQQFVPATYSGNETSHRRVLNFDVETESNLTNPAAVKFPEKRETPSKLCATSQVDFSKDSSDSEGSRTFWAPTESDIRRESALGSSAFIPAGMHRSTRKYRSKKSHKENGDLEYDYEAKPIPSFKADNCEPDFSAIPAPQSLSRKKEHSLGVSSIGIGDPLSEDEGFDSPTVLFQPRLAQHQDLEDENISDHNLDRLLKSDKSQRILKLASQQTNRSLQSKLLPAKSTIPSGTIS